MMRHNEEETEFRGNLPSSHASDHAGSRIFGMFGSVLMLSTLVILAIIALIWWLSPA